MAMKDLHSEIMENILLRLPVKSLLRSKCVCKEWFNIISRPQFAKSHLRHPQTQARIGLCIIDYGDNTDDKVVGYLHSTTEYDDNGELLDPHRFDDIEETLNLNSPKILDSCDGLFCFVGGYHKIVLWNPSTRQHNQLPPNPNLSDNDFSPYREWESPRGIEKIENYYGFGYDSFSDDYKIVGVFVPDHDSNIRIDVFSLKSYSWRRILQKDYDADSYVENENGVVFHGAAHWIASSSSPSSSKYDRHPIILAFDFEKEQFKEMKIPVNTIVRARLQVIEERLCLYDHYQDEIEKWVMEEYGVESSWIKLPPPIYMHINIFNEQSSYQLWGFLNSKYLLRVDFWEFILWDHKENTEHEVMTFEPMRHRRPMFFVETLVSPYSSFHTPIV